MSWWQILIGYLITVVAMSFMWHRLVMMGRASEPPHCFESDPNPQERAENDCDNCPWREQCLGF